MLNGADMQGWNGKTISSLYLLTKRENSGLLERGWDNIQKR